MVKCQKESSHYICLSVILIDFVFEMGKNYYPQVFLEDVNINMLLKKKKKTSHITEKLYIPSDDWDKSEKE